MTTYKRFLSEPWFSLIKLGHKTCDGRLNRGDFARMRVGDYIIFKNNDFGPRRIKCKITFIHKYDSFLHYLDIESLEDCLPGIDDMDEGLDIYYKKYSEEDEEQYGILGIGLKVVKM